ncbi:hypothetical protein QQZ08_012429 [Neonectria magnoliae]|uniref:Uncharacterized protein n=1 Tax=Neonectria magnoliae TaxID=2732573 RepID=A0ABR1H249_9HYPO
MTFALITILWFTIRVAQAGLLKRAPLSTGLLSLALAATNYPTSATAAIATRPFRLSVTVSTDTFTLGPNAVTRYETDSGDHKFEPLERWSHGLLAEDSSAPTKFGNRGTTGRGWAVNAGVGWNLLSDVTFEFPPLGINWCVGCGSPGYSNGNATLIDSGHQVKPRSLFAAQFKAGAGTGMTEELIDRQEDMMLHFSVVNMILILSTVFGSRCTRDCTSPPS